MTGLMTKGALQRGGGRQSLQAARLGTKFLVPVAGELHAAGSQRILIHICRRRRTLPLNLPVLSAIGKNNNNTKEIAMTIENER